MSTLPLMCRCVSRFSLLLFPAMMCVNWPKLRVGSWRSPSSRDLGSVSAPAPHCVWSNCNVSINGQACSSVSSISWVIFSGSCSIMCTPKPNLSDVACWKETCRTRLPWLCRIDCNWLDFSSDERWMCLYKQYKNAGCHALQTVKQLYWSLASRNPAICSSISLGSIIWVNEKEGKMERNATWSKKACPASFFRNWCNALSRKLI